MQKKLFILVPLFIFIGCFSDNTNNLNESNTTMTTGNQTFFGSVIFESHNDGASWFSTHSDIQPFIINIIDYDNRKFAILSSGHIALEKIDGRWNNIAKIDELDESTIENPIVVGENMIFLDGDIKSWNSKTKKVKKLFGINIEDVNLKSLMKKDNFLFVATNNGLIFRSDDNGKNWKEVYKSDTPDWLSSVESNRNHSIVFASTDGKYIQSVDNGESWHDMNITYHKQIYSFVIFENYFLVSDDIGNVFKSFDGKKWYKIFDNSHNEKSIARIQSINNQIYVSFSKEQETAFMKSEDNGKTWKNLTTIPIAIPACKFYYEKNDNTLVVFGGEPT